MKRRRTTKTVTSTVAWAGMAALLLGTAVAQTGAPAEPTGQKTLAATIGVYVFPNSGQTPEQQSMDEAECYSWAVQQTGTDPFDLAKQAEQQKQQAEEANQQIEQQAQAAQQANQQQLDDFKKAFSVCLESKEYMVK